MNRIAIISGSHRPNGASGRVAAKLGELILEHLPGNDFVEIPIADIPLWDEGKWGEPALAAKWSAWEPAAQALKAADALIVVSPEYGGMVPPRLTNFLLLCSGEEIGHKPALAVSVSATRGGAYPITQLRSYAYKNNHVCWIPDHLIVRNLDDERDPFPPGSYEARFALYCLRLLDSYATALTGVRASGIVDHGTYPYGM